MSKLRFSFGMIVFNGEAFLREALESIYDFAYEIIVLEGPDRNALPMAGPDGGRDGNLEILNSFPDPKKEVAYHSGSMTGQRRAVNSVYAGGQRGLYMGNR
jgi:hypothetical protein